ncbi:DnaD domain protein [Alkalibacillus haloalkaliphilus]|uniref:DNA replication protein DnaD n=1 Tax=Alkalibacillus haloalkaliphilus TaxID=94136 RepID=A0A511W237_9BACI|nr:DnaD domain protein [Alkalibacillus haloalkaliphilus]MDV2580800.1 DnaD domain protein [Alkalibacillus haloalkaliphilus]GEN45126.1 DNA replication protein DnaD [Alkalibacillus haloalkaliphilus]
MELPFSYQRLLTEQINIPSKLLNDYHELGLNEEDIIVILQIMNLQKSGELLPSFDQIASHMTINANEVANVLKKLRNNNYLQIEQITDEQNGQHEWYCLSPLFEALFEVEQESTQEEEGKLFQLFEQEFARTLSPIEIETVSYWLDEDQFKPPLIKAALREAVLMGKLNFRYIDRILNEWKKKGVRSVNDVKQSSQQKQNQQAPKEKRDTSVYYNWLEE